ncbi:hypothetical protein [Flavobacterium sp.]|uniref:hypothetical protein n=1 Tax=Flavobacterium sp. TaxID=239 RepID=UPI00121B15E5|nr:hypothetical protein [Flavobacterium sp.]RZJ70294.1 MAG: hypothetical protein EOO49_14280 [Flavobacterium sp.]
MFSFIESFLSFFRNKSDEQNPAADQVVIPQKISAPKWEAGFDPSALEVFRSELEKYFAKKKVTFSFSGNKIFFDDDQERYEDHNIVDLTQKCRETSTEHYGKCIRKFYDTMAKTNAEVLAYLEKADDFFEAQIKLGTGLFTNEFDDFFGEKGDLVTKEFAPGIYVVLVFYFKTKVVAVPREKFEKWNVPIEELFETGIENTWGSFPTLTQPFLTDGVEYKIIHADFFAPNEFLRRGGYHSIFGEKGALVSLLSQNKILYCPIENPDMTAEMRVIVPVVSKLFDEAASPLSDKIFWTKTGEKLIEVPYSVAFGKLDFTLTEEIVHFFSQAESQ